MEQLITSEEILPKLNAF